MQVVRLSSQDVPTAYAYELEAATVVQPEQVVEAVQRVVGLLCLPEQVAHNSTLKCTFQ